MYVSTQNVKPTRRTFFVCLVAFFFLSGFLIFDSESSSDGRILGYWSFTCSILFGVLGSFVIFGKSTRDSIFGYSVCPHCNEKGWNIKEKMKITGNPNTNFGRCLFCKKKGKISFLYSITILIPIFSWPSLLVLTGSVSVAFAGFVALCFLYIYFFARRVPISG
jgi:hypothetical protein